MPALAVLDANLGDVYCLVGEREAAQLMRNLRAVNAEDAVQLVEARMAEIKGELKSAEARFGELGRSHQPTVLYQSARFFRDLERYPQAIAMAERLETSSSPIWT